MQIAITHATALAPDPALLTEPERAVLATLRGPRRRDEWIRGRVALHRLLGPDVSVLPDASGAPRTWSSARLPSNRDRPVAARECPTARSDRRDARVAESRSTNAGVRSEQVRTGASWFEHAAPLCSSVMPVRAASASLASASSQFGPATESSCVSLAHDGEWFAVAVADRAVGIDLCLRVHAERVAKILAWLGVCGSPIDPVAAWAALEAVLKLRRLGIEELRGRPIELRANHQPIGRQPAQAHVESIVVLGIGEPVTVQLRGDAEYVIGWAVELSDGPIIAQFHSDLVQDSERNARANDAVAVGELRPGMANKEAA